MLSNEIETTFEDGEWITKTQAAVIFEVSERTIENRIKGGSLSSKVDEGKTLVFVKSSKLGSKPVEALPNNSKPFATIPHKFESSSKTCDECSKLRKELDDLRNDLSKEREAHAELRGEMKTKNDLIKAKDETITAKDQAINAANAAIMIQEKHSAPAIKAETSNPGEPRQEDQEGAKKNGLMVWVGKVFGR